MLCRNIFYIQTYFLIISFEEDAERICEEYLKMGLDIDPESIDVMQTYASFRISQNRKHEACILLENIYDKLMAIRNKVHSRNIIDEIIEKPEPEEFLGNEQIYFYCAGIITHS